MTSVVCPHSFKYRVQVTAVDRQHGTAGHKDAGQIQPCRRHQHAGDDFITVRNEHQPVKLMSPHHTFDGIGDQFSGRKGILHPFMSHGQPVTNPDGIEFHGCAAAHENPILHSTGNTLQMNMPRYNFIEGIDHANQRSPHLFVGISHGFHQRPFRRVGEFL